jgi:hypothetical protein
MTYTNQSAATMSPRPAPQTQPFQFSQYQTQVSQPIFPQPSGNIYFINNSLEVANIPVGVGTSAVLCLPENLIYLKSMQNGMPMLLGYKISPLETPTAAPTQEETQQQPTQPTVTAAPPIQHEENMDKFKEEFNNKIKTLEDSIAKLQEKIGGLVECQF